MPQKKRVTSKLTDQEREDAIMNASRRHFENEGPTGRRQRRVADEAIADMIGSAQYLAIRLGKARARKILASVHHTL